MPTWKFTVEGPGYIIREEENLFACLAAIATWSLMSVSDMVVDRTWAGLEFIKVAFFANSASSLDVQFSLILNPSVNGEKLGKVEVIAVLPGLRVESKEYDGLQGNTWARELSIQRGAREVAKVQLSPLGEYPNPQAIAEGLVEGIQVVLSLLREELRSQGDMLDKHLKSFAPETL